MWGVLVASIAPMLTKFFWWILATLGIGTITYLGFDALLTQIESQISLLEQSLPTKLYQIMGLFGVWQAIGIMLSAYASRIAIRTVGGAVSRLGLIG